MMKTILLSTFFFLIHTFSVNVSASLPKDEALEESAQISNLIKKENGYKCIFDKGGPVPDPDNPYQAQPIILSEQFLEKRPFYQFPSSEDEGVIVLGDYLIDTNFYLGGGDDGDLYLGRHTPSGIYIAAKKRGMHSLKTEKHHEYRKLRALGQLYSAWIDNSNDTYATAYLLIPFVDGKVISTYQNHVPWIKTTLEDGCLKFSDLSAGVKLIRSLLDQLLYLAKKGIKHHDSYSGNIMITHDYENVVLVDFGYSGDMTDSSSINLSPVNLSEFNAYPHVYYSNYFLGTNRYNQELKHAEIENPFEVVNFLKIVSNISGDFSPVFLSTFNDAVQELEKYFYDLTS